MFPAMLRLFSGVTNFVLSPLFLLVNLFLLLFEIMCILRSTCNEVMSFFPVFACKCCMRVVERVSCTENNSGVH